MRVLIVTKIFPNAVEPAVAPYNRHQFCRLARRCEVDLLALVPWLPGLGRLSDTARARARIPAEEHVDGLRVRHPRVLYAPKLGRPLSGALYTASLLPALSRERGRYDVILGSFAYPDGWTAVALGRLLDAPAVIKLHGSDINIYGDDPLLRPALRWALSQAAAVVGPSQPLVDKAVSFGAAKSRARAIPNGIDPHRFHPRDKDATRATLGRPSKRKQLVFVGRLEAAKGVFELLEAVERLPDATRRACELVLVGDGVDRARLERIVGERDLPVHFAGMVEPDEVALWIGAGDVVVLPSWAEGTPNVIIEALASGRPVVASDVGGIPALLDDPRLGELVPVKNSEALSEALARALDRDDDAETIAARAGFPSWDESTDALHEVLARAARDRN